MKSQRTPKHEANPVTKIILVQGNILQLINNIDIQPLLDKYQLAFILWFVEVFKLEPSEISFISEMLVSDDSKCLTCKQNYMELILCIIAKINSILKPTSFEVDIINERKHYLGVKQYLIETIDFLNENSEEIGRQLAT